MTETERALLLAVAKWIIANPAGSSDFDARWVEYCLNDLLRD